MKKETGLGGTILKDGNSIKFKTGSWKSRYPVHSRDLCKSCMLCIPYCPENCIKEKDGVCMGMDLDYCKGCGVCAKVCPFHAIEMKTKNEVK